MQFFTPDLQSPESLSELLVTPFLFSFFGVFMYIGAVRFEESYGKKVKWWKWCMLPLVIGLIFGIQRIVFLNDLFYANTVISRKLKIGHYLTFLVPFLSAAGILIHKKLQSREGSLYKNAS
jgi:hypothetical protein